MRRFFHTVLDTGFRLRCPVCEQGALFEDTFNMHAICPHCSVRFERYEGEVTGGMSISIVVTSVIFLVGLYVTEFVLHWPLALQLLLWVAFAVIFPIIFYRYSRALWVVILHLGGDVHWDREPYVESDLSLLDAFLHDPSDDTPPTNPPPFDDDPPPPFHQPKPRL